jgi:hypothetical protein
LAWIFSCPLFSLFFYNRGGGRGVEREEGRGEEDEGIEERWNQVYVGRKNRRDKVICSYLTTFHASVLFCFCSYIPSKFLRNTQGMNQTSLYNVLIKLFPKYSIMSR